jgi:shikimate dehydrogenase
MMAAALRGAGIEGRYDAFDVAPPLNSAHLERLYAGGIQGANVTVPHKEAALALALEAPPAARAIGAANVLVRLPRGWRADNTDGPGFRDWIDSHEAAKTRVNRATILGAGGSARAVVWALLEAGAPRVRVASRTRARAERLALDFSGRVEVQAFSDLDLEDALLVNCTPLGMNAADPLPVEQTVLARAGAVLDLVYPASRLVRAARELGIAAENGLPLLVAQGARAFRLWTGIDPDRQAMYRAAEAEAARRAGADATHP